MALIVQKYGGTSVGSVDRIKNVARRIAKWHRAGHQVVVVVSAMSGETNRLIGLAKEIQASPGPAGARADRQRVHQGAHPRDRREEDPGRPGGGLCRCGGRFPGGRRARQHHHPGPRRLRHLGRGDGRGAESRRVPDLHRCGRRLHHRPAHRPRGAPPDHGDLRGDAGDGQPRLQGAADPLGGVCGTHPWKRPSSPA